MDWLKIIAIAFSIMNWLIERAKINKAISADRAEQLAAHLQKVNDEIKLAQAERDRIRADPTRGMRGDPLNRDNP